MRAFTGDEKTKLYNEALELIKRANELILAARKEHELAMEFISKILPNNPSAEDWRAAVNAYKDGRVKSLSSLGDSKKTADATAGRG